MKIAILLLNKGRGSGEVARQHAQYLLGKGHDIYFIHPGIEKSVRGAKNVDVNLEGKIMPVHEYLPSAAKNQKAVSIMDFDEAIEYVPFYEKALESIIEDLDIIIGHHANLTAIATANIAKKYDKPYVLFLHGTGIEPRHHGHFDDKIWALIQSSIENANGIIVTTEYVRDNLVRNLIDIPLNKFIILACGIDLSEFQPENICGIKDKYNLPEKYVICPGALTLTKGPQNIVEASKYYYELAPTIFIGDGELRSDLEKQLGDRGRFLGFVSADDKAKLINAATILVAAPEKKEHFGIIYTEALAGGTPVVAYEGGGVHSIVTEETGILTKRTPETLGKAVKGLLQEQKKYDTMVIKGRQRAKELFSTLSLGAKLEKWLILKCKM